MTILSLFMRILVTGGAGFIGSHLCEELLNERNEVVCLDALYSGKKENIKLFLDNAHFSFIKWDVRNSFPKKIGSFDRIYHLACPASPQQYQFDPILTLETIVLGMGNVLKLARKTGARVLYTSTSEIYGDPLEHPQNETYWGNVDPIGQRACYDEGKRAAEALCKDYNEQYGVDARIVRIFNTYGPRMMFNDGRVLSNFIVQALSGNDITVHGDGSQTRSFCYVDDLIVGLIRRMEVNSQDWRPVNLGNPEERTILNVAKMIQKHIGSQSKIECIPYNKIHGREGDPKKRCPDISRAKELLNWEPSISFEEGVKRTIDDFTKRMENKPRILVFSTTYAPITGPAEQAVEEVVKRMTEYDFDMITAKMRPNLASEEQRGNVQIYRVGSGKKMDKFFLPLRGAVLARKLHKKHKYQIGWAIMASYAALAFVLFRIIVRNVPFLLSVYEGDITKKKLKRGKILSPLYRFILRSAHRWQVVGNMDMKQQAWLEDERKVQAVNIEGDFDKLTKKTRDMFQDIEILSTRI